MPADLFQTLNIADVRHVLETLHERIACRNGRIEITCDGSDQSCVIISKAELESLERALEILASTDDAQEMRDLLNNLAAGDMPGRLGDSFDKSGKPAEARL